MSRRSSAPRRRRGGARRDVTAGAALARFANEESTGGKLLLVATFAALLWANLSPATYASAWSAVIGVGPDWLDLHLTVGQWVSDGLLSVFFFVVGLEVKRELTIGELSARAAAMLPLLAAIGGMVAPALIALVVSGGQASDGRAWAVPVATDVALALGVLSVAGRVPSGVRTVLLAIAVIDDMLGIALIAVVFTVHIHALWLLAAGCLCAAYWLAIRSGPCRLVLLAVLGGGVWICLHASGVHATVAGIALAALTPVRPTAREPVALGARLER